MTVKKTVQKKTVKGSAGGDVVITTKPGNSNDKVKISNSLDDPDIRNTGLIRSGIKGSSDPGNSLSDYEKEEKANQKVMRESNLKR
jgi:hypothetical protein